MNAKEILNKKKPFVVDVLATFAPWRFKYFILFRPFLLFTWTPASCPLPLDFLS
jgi:hypothetical protein